MITVTTVIEKREMRTVGREEPLRMIGVQVPNRREAFMIECTADEYLGWRMGDRVVVTIQREEAE